MSALQLEGVSPLGGTAAPPSTSDRGQLYALPAPLSVRWRFARPSPAANSSVSCRASFA